MSTYPTCGDAIVAIAAMAVPGWWWAGLIPAAALLPGAALAPADPVVHGIAATPVMRLLDRFNERNGSPRSVTEAP